MAHETAVKDKIEALLRERKIWFVKVHGEAMQKRGIPDLICCYEGRFVALEVKDKGNFATPLQRYELARIAKAGGEQAVVYSVADVEKVLEGMAAKRAEKALVQ